VILLKSKKDDLRPGVLVDYKRTPAHIAEARLDVQALNAYRAEANIRCLASLSRIDPSDRHSKRRWTRSSWYCGGRHWGGFWQTMRKEERLNLILIDDEPVVSIDFSATIATLAYAAVGQAAPAGDLYDLKLLDKHGTQVETDRKTRKTIFIAAMNGAKDWPKEFRKTLRSRISWLRVRNCLKRAHPAIAVYFDADKGQELANTEANIRPRSSSAYGS
jgi:hypothetical protein